MTDATNAEYVTVNTVREVKALDEEKYPAVLIPFYVGDKPRLTTTWDVKGWADDALRAVLPATVLTPATRPSDDAENPPNRAAAEWHEAHRRWPFAEDETDTGCNRARRWAFVQGARWAASTPQTPDDVREAVADAVAMWIGPTREPEKYAGLVNNLVAALSATRPATVSAEGIRDMLYNQFAPFLAHNPHNPDVFWGSATDAVIRRLRAAGIEVAK